MAQTALKIVPRDSATNIQKFAAAHNNYLETEWTMKNGLKVMVKQGDLVEAETEVIVNLANSELYHRGGAARAISVAAGSELDNACMLHIRQYGSVKVGRAMHSTAGNLRPRIKYVIHAVNRKPNANEIADRQECFDFVQSMVLYSLKHTEYVLEAVSMSLPAISAGLFGVLKSDVAQAMYQAILKFDKSKPKKFKVVHIVNIDNDVTGLIDREFAWGFGGLSEMTDSYLGYKI